MISPPGRRSRVERLEGRSRSTACDGAPPRRRRDRSSRREREREDVRLDEGGALDPPEPLTRSVDRGRDVGSDELASVSLPPRRQPGARREPGAAAGVEDSLTTREVVAHRFTGREPVALEDPGGDLLLHPVGAEPRAVRPLVAEALLGLVLPGILAGPRNVGCPLGRNRSLLRREASHP